MYVIITHVMAKIYLKKLVYTLHGMSPSEEM